MGSQTPQRAKVGERFKTDQSLRLERRKADREVERRSARTAEDADQVVAAARKRAADVLAQARRGADRGPHSTSAESRLRTRRARAKANALLERQYSAADARTARERATRVRALARLFLAERQVTDDRLRTERSLSDKLVLVRDDLLAQVSHDLRGFLGAIGLRAEFLSRSAPQHPDAPTTEAILGIKEAVAMMGRLVGDLLDTASMESGTFRIEKDDSRLDELVLHSAEAFREAAAEKRITLTVTTAKCPPARFDHQRILQVLANIVGNALKFSPSGGRIALRLEGAGGQCQISVADSGPGIPRAKLKSVFDKFTGEERANRGGLGLGLFIVRSIVEAHGGKVWAKSAPGRGSTFYFTLPAAGPGSRS